MLLLQFCIHSPTASSHKGSEVVNAALVKAHKLLHPSGFSNQSVSSQAALSLLGTNYGHGGAKEELINKMKVLVQGQRVKYSLSQRLRAFRHRARRRQEFPGDNIQTLSTTRTCLIRCRATHL